MLLKRTIHGMGRGGDDVWAWKELAITTLKVLPRHSPGETEENHEHKLAVAGDAVKVRTDLSRNISVQQRYCIILLDSMRPPFS
jgi:hypothetical protein